MRAYEFIIEGVTDDIAVAEFKKYTENNKIVNPEVVDKTVALFKELIKFKVINPKDVPDGNPSDISYWKKKGWPAFYKFVQDKQHEYQIVKMSKSRGNKGNYKLVAELPDWLIVLPLDIEASCFAGKNTKLCVARVAAGHFERYFYEDNMNLLYFINKSGTETWLVAFDNEGHIRELADQNNDHINDDFAQEFFKRTGLDLTKYINQTLGTHTSDLTAARGEHADFKQQIIDWLDTKPTTRNREIEYMLYTVKDAWLLEEYLVAVGGMHEKLVQMLAKLNPGSIRVIYHIMPDIGPGVGKIAVTADGEALRDIPRKYRDYTMCLAAVKQQGSAIDAVPPELRDYDMYYAAVKHNGRVLSYVLEKAKELCDYKMCLAAVSSYGRALEYVPKDFRDYDMYYAAVKQDGSVLQPVPDDFRDYELCFAAVSSYGQALFYVPDKLRDYKMCLAAVSQDRRAIYDVPKTLPEYDDLAALAYTGK
jgi:hypothetical protein